MFVTGYPWFGVTVTEDGFDLPQLVEWVLGRGLG